MLLSLWLKWGDKVEVAIFIEDLTNTEVGVLQLLRSLAVRSFRKGVDSYATKERYYMRSKDIETLISPDSLNVKVRDISVERLAEEDRRAVNAFRNAIERRKTGEADDNPFARD